MAKRKRRIPKHSTYDIDVIIPVYGQPELLKKCLASIEASTGNLKIQTILVDDCGPNQEALGELYHSLNGASRVIRNEVNSGFPRTVNAGLKTATAPFVLILNSDIELEPDAISKMVAEFDDSQVGIVGPKLLFPPDSTDPHRPAGKIQHAGLGVNFQGQIIHPNVGWNADHSVVNERRECQAVTGACLMVRRDVLRTVLKTYQQSGDPTNGPFNEVYGKGSFEDVELCFVVRSLNYKVIYTPHAVGYHHVGASVGASGGYPLNRNELIFRARCGPLLYWDEWKFA
jgi:GT2 family glycosyltransferase